MNADSGRWRSTLAMPLGMEMRMEHGGAFFVAARSGAYFTFADAIERGWVERVPFPAPAAIGSFA